MVCIDCWDNQLLYIKGMGMMCGIKVEAKDGKA